MHVYLFSGLGVDDRAFQNIILNDIDVTHVKWIDPLVNESMRIAGGGHFMIVNRADEISAILNILVND